MKLEECNEDVLNFVKPAKKKYKEDWQDYISFSEASVTIKKCPYCDRKKEHMTDAYPRWYGTCSETNTSVFVIHCWHHKEDKQHPASNFIELI